MFVLLIANFMKFRPLVRKLLGHTRTIGFLGFDSPQGPGIFLFTTVSRTALGPILPPIQWVLGALSLRVKRPGRTADHLPSSNVEVKNAWSYTSTPPIRLHGLVFYHMKRPSSCCLYDGVSKRFRTESIMKYTLTFGIAR
jgi:hypothetical protein